MPAPPRCSASGDGYEQVWEQSSPVLTRLARHISTAGVLPRGSAPPRAALLERPRARDMEFLPEPASSPRHDDTCLRSLSDMRFITLAGRRETGERLGMSDVDWRHVILGSGWAYSPVRPGPVFRTIHLSTSASHCRRHTEQFHGVPIAAEG